jgi:hypothetical protein
MKDLLGIRLIRHEEQMMMMMMMQWSTNIIKDFIVIASSIYA